MSGSGTAEEISATAPAPAPADATPAIFPRRITARQPFVGLALAAMLGIFCADRWPQNDAILFSALALTAFPAAGIRKNWTTLFFVACAFFALHTLNFHRNASREFARAFSSEPRAARVTGIVLDEPQRKAMSDRYIHAHFPLRVESAAIGGEPPRGCDAKMLVKWRGEPPHFGDRVEIRGAAKRVPPARNPGQFDYTAYLQRSGIFSEIEMRRPDDARVLAGGCGNPLIAFALKSRAWMQRKLALDLDDAPDIAGMIQGMVLGQKAETPADIKEMFQRTGTLHLFVVNGLHVGMFAALVWFLARPLQLGPRWSALVIVPVIFFYALVTGASPGSIRAAIMAAIVLLARVVERPPSTFNSFAAAGFFLLLWDTNELFMPAAQFSFGVVASILFFAGKFQRRLLPLGAPDSFLPRPLWSVWMNTREILRRRLVQLLGVSLAAWIGSLPFTATYFHLFSPSAVVANLFVVPMAFAMLAQGVLAILCGIFSNPLAAIFNNSNWAIAKVILFCVKIFTQIPGGHAYVELPKFHAAAPCEINVLDLDDGGAIHVRSGGCDWLFDCGGAFDCETIVRPYLRTRGVNRLDGLLLSHGDAAHIGGASLLLADFLPRRIVDSPLTDRSRQRLAFHGELAARGIGKGIFQRDDWLTISPASRVRVLYPPAGLRARTADDKCLVLQLESAGARVLFVFDSGFFTEKWLLENERDLRSDVLVKGRHASDISGTMEFIDAVAPLAIVTSATQKMPLKISTELAQTPREWPRQIAARGIALFHQDETGAVKIEIARDGFSMRGFANGQFFSSPGRP